MILRLILFLIFYGGLLGGASALIYYGGRKLLKDPLERRKIQLRGLRNAKLLEKNECYICLALVNTQNDSYSNKYGWYHHNCHEGLLHD